MRRAIFAYNGWLRKQYDEKRDLALAMECGKCIPSKERANALLAVSLAQGASRTQAEDKAHAMRLVSAR